MIQLIISLNQIIPSKSIKIYLAALVRQKIKFIVPQTDVFGGFFLGTILGASFFLSWRPMLWSHFEFNIAWPRNGTKQTN